MAVSVWIRKHSTRTAEEQREWDGVRKDKRGKELVHAGQILCEKQEKTKRPVREVGKHRQIPTVWKRPKQGGGPFLRRRSAKTAVVGFCFQQEEKMPHFC